MIAPEFNYVELSRSALQRMTLCDTVKCGRGGVGGVRGVGVGGGVTSGGRRKGVGCLFVCLFVVVLHPSNI